MPVTTPGMNGNSGGSWVQDMPAASKDAIQASTENPST